MRRDSEQPLDSFEHQSAGWRERVTKREVVETFTRTRFAIPHYGFIERIEVTPRTGLLPNFDAGKAPYTVESTLRDSEGHEVECFVEAIFRNVTDAPK